MLGRLVKRGFKLNEFDLSDWNRPTVLLYTVCHFLVFVVSTSCAHCFNSNSDSSLAVTS